ncbi:MerR family transcriptional regulator [Plantactinospora sp. B24E8]|uniref:MerR family transcriptional regulator n=1 Tax=Plantactinospora sp. B24E8 TaxID=3153567 RepID=UPI00325EE1AA
MEAVRIGELARVTGTTPRALRHYEQAGLIASERAENGYRVYGTISVVRVRNIRHLVAAGFTLDDIRTFQSCLDHDLAATSASDPDVAAGPTSGPDLPGGASPALPTLDEVAPTPECVDRAVQVARGRLAVLDERISAQVRARERLAATVRRVAEPRLPEPA